MTTNDNDSDDSSPSYEVKSIVKGWGVLEALANEGRATASELAATTGVNRTGVYRFLMTFRDLGLVAERDGRFELAGGAFRLGATYIDNLLFRQIALIYAIDLYREVVSDRPWAVAISIADRDEIILIERIWSPNAPLASLLAIGTRLPMENSASGLSILATLPEQERRGLVGHERYEAMRAEVERTEQRSGVAFMTSHVASGITGMATAVRNRTGQPVGAVGIYGSGVEESVQGNEQLVTTLQRAAQLIEHALRQQQ